jgi:VIT1/CCC1 family predicted Fe2+/Mn2+ transporter
MNLPVTIALVVAFGLLAGLFGWLGARPKIPGKPQMVPWQFLMMLTAALALLMLVHLLNLFGLQTGGQQQR